MTGTEVRDIPVSELRVDSNITDQIERLMLVSIQS